MEFMPDFDHEIYFRFSLRFEPKDFLGMKLNPLWLIVALLLLIFLEIGFFFYRFENRTKTEDFLLLQIHNNLTRIHNCIFGSDTTCSLPVNLERP